MKERNNSKLTVIVLLIITLVASVLIVLFIILAANNLDSNQERTMNSQPSIEEQAILGEAPVTVLESGDFTCSSCNTRGEISFTKLLDDYAYTDKVKTNFRVSA